MSFVDPALVLVPAPGVVVPAPWGQTVRDNYEFLVDPPFCAAFNSADQLVQHDGFGPSSPNNVTPLEAPDEFSDSFGMHSTVVDNTRIHAPVPGRYHATAVVTLPSSADTSHRGIVEFRVNGNTIVFGDVRQLIGSSATATVSATRTVVLDAGHYVECAVRQNTGSDQPFRLVEFALLLATI